MKQQPLGINDWLEKKSQLEEEIRIQATALSRIPNGYGLTIEANEAKSRLRNFLQLHGPVEKLTGAKKRDYENLKNDSEHKEAVAREAVARHYQAKTKLDQLKEALADLRGSGIKNIDGESGIELLLKKASAPLLALIEDAKAAIVNLKDRLAGLRAEKSGIDAAPVRLDDETLLSVDINTHHAMKKSQKEAAEKAQALDDLIQQVERAIVDKEAHLKKLRLDISTTLRTVVEQYMGMVAREFSGQFEKIIETDSICADMISRACSELVQQSGASHFDVFGALGSVKSPLKISPLHYMAGLKSEMKRFVGLAE